MKKPFVLFSQKRRMRFAAVLTTALLLVSASACSPLVFEKETSLADGKNVTTTATTPANTRDTTLTTTTATVTTATTTETTTTATVTTTTVTAKPTTTVTAKPTTTVTAKPTTKVTAKPTTAKPKSNPSSVSKFNVKNIPAFSGKPYVKVNNNVPFFTNADCTTTSFERYSPLDALGRCGVAFACIGTDVMPTEKRGEIGMVKPSGWHTVKYDCIADKYLYNRCHLIAYELAGENANIQNLITGTRYMNVSGMLPFENKVAAYVERTNHHVLYRVTPIFEGNNLVATGVLMEAYSVEDAGKGICFNVFCYNCQPHIAIDYADGSSKQTGGFVATTKATTKKATTTAKIVTPVGEGVTYVLNTNTHKFHKPDCPSVGDIVAHNRQDVDWSRDDVMAAGFVPCKRCNP